MANQIRYQVGFDVQQNNLNQLKSSLQQLQKMKISDIMKINDSDAASATSTLNKIKDEAGKVEDALKQAFNTKLNTVNIETFNQSLQKSGTSVEQIYQTFKAAGSTGESAFRSLSSSVLSTNIQLKETHNLLDKMAATLANTVKWNIASSAVNEVTRSVEQAWGYVKSLDTSLNDIRIVTGKSAEEMGKFAVQANNASKELGKTTTDYTNAALIYAQQGLSDKEIEERTKITLKAANVTNQSSDAVSEQLTAVWNGYKVNAEEAQLYVDRLAAVAATTASDLEELSTGMSKVASAAAAMGVGEEQLAAQLSTIISVTKQAPESVGTALRTVYARISDIQAGIAEDGVTLGNYSGKMADLGINVLDVNGKLRNMGQVMEEIGGKWGDMSREQQVYLAQTMAGQRQYNNLLALFDNFEQYNEALVTAQNAAGTLQDQQDTYMESTSAHLKVLKASMEDIYDSLINTDSMNGLIDGLSVAASLMSNFVDSLGGGGNLLKSLGSIGLMVFSEQIAKGINATITNLEIAKENAIQFDQALQATKDWQGIPGLDEISQKLLVNREQLLELARLMTPEQFSGLQNMLNELTEAQNQMANLGTQEEILDGMIKAVTTAEDKWEGLNEVLQDSEAQEEIINRIGEQESAFLEVNSALTKYGNNLKSVGSKLTEDGQDGISNNLNEMRNNLQGYIDKVQELAANGAMERHENAVNKLGKRLNQLPKDLPDEQLLAELEAIAGALRGMTANAGNAAKDIRKKLEIEFQGTAESVAAQVEEVSAKATQITGKFEASMGRMFRAVTVENITKVVGGISSLGMAIQQVQNLGSIWKNEDLSTGEKVLQTITNLSMSIGMAIPAFTNLNKVLKLVTISKAEDAAVSKTAAAANKTFMTSLSVKPVFGVITAITALVTVLGTVIKALDEANEAAIRSRQAEIEEENKKQEQIETNKKLFSSLEDLNKQYESGEITRSDLKSTIQDLIDQYGLEGEAADKLARSYDNLNGYIKQTREQAIEAAKESADRELTAARDAVNRTAKGDTLDANRQSGNEYILNITGGAGGAKGLFADEPEQIIKLLKEAGGIASSENPSYFTFIKDFDTASIAELYDTIQGVIDKINELRDTGELTDQQIQDSEYYQNMKLWLDQMKKSVEEYKTALEEVHKYSTELMTITNNIDFSNVQNIGQYATQRANLIAEVEKMLQEKGEDTSGASEMADTYLRDNFRDIYTKYSEAADYIDKIEEKLGENTEKRIKIENALSSLDEEHLDALMNIDPSTIQNWEALEEVIQRIANVDLSNVVTAIELDPAAVQANAADKYNIYQSLEDQVRSGKTISKTEMESLDPEIQKFFSIMANGTFKMTEDAEEFYDKISNLKLSGFYDALDVIERKLNQIQTIQSKQGQKSFNYDELNQSANEYKTLPDGSTPFNPEINQDLVEKQLDYLQVVTDTNSELGIQVDKWADLAETGKLSKEHVEAIADAVSEVGDQTGDLTDRVNKLNDMSIEIGHQLHDAMFPTDSDVDTEVLESLSETLQSIAEQSDELADSLNNDARAAEDVAESVLRFDNAIEDIVDNYEDWIDALNSGSIQEQAEVIDDLRDAYADMLDLDGSALSNDFLTNAENLDLMKAAIDGNIEAYNELLSRAGQDIITHLQLSPEDYTQFQTELVHVQSLMDDMNFQEIEIGAALDDTKFIEGLQNMVNAAGMTAQQATDYLASMGVDAEVIEQKTEGTETKTTTGFNAEWKPVTARFSVPTMAGNSIQTVTGEYVGQSLSYEPVTVNAVDTKENTAFSLKVTSAHKSSGGKFKYSQAKNGGGSKGISRRSGGSGGGKKGGSGGSSKAPEPDTSQKDPKKVMEDTRDIYHDINVELEQIDRRLDRVQKKQDRLYGKQLLNNLNQQSKILDEHKVKLEEKHALQERDLKSQQQTLANLGVTFDKYGNIANYMDVLINKQAQINAKTAEYNSLIEVYNASTDREAKKQIADQAENLNKQIKQYEDEYKKLEDKIKGYDSLREDMEDIVDQIEEETQKQIEINIKKFRMEVQIRLEMGEAERDWNQFRREVLEHTDIIKDTDLSEIFSDSMQNIRDITSYFNVKGSRGSLETLTNQLMDTRAEIEAIDKTGNSAIYGDNKAQAMKDLQEDLQELMSQMEDIQGLIDNIDKAYLDTIDNIEEQFDKQIQDYEYIEELIEHDIDLLSLLYGDKNYDAMDKYYSTLERNNLKQLDSLRKQRDFWKQQWDAAAANGDVQAAKQFEENYKNTIKNLNETIEESAKNIQDKYINAIDKIFDELDKKISNGKGTDYLSTQWELMNKNADEYLDTINSAFAIQETERKYQKALNETKSIKNQQALKKLMDEQLGILRNKEKITQYDVERAEKLLQVEQARIALQDAQSAKTSMRLKRDSQGNYSYEYVADDGAVDDAQANLGQTQNDLYNFDKDQYQSNLDNMLAAWRDFQSDYKEILNDTSLTEQDRIERLALLREQYGQYINDKTLENLSIRNNLMESAFADLAVLYNTDVENYNQMSIDEQNILMSDLVPAWQSGIQQMTDKVAGEGGFIPTCEDAFNNIADVTKEYKNELDDMAQTAGLDLAEVKNGVDDLAYSFEELIINNETLTTVVYNEMEAISLLRAEAHSLVAEYKSVYDAAKLAVSGIHSFIQAQQAQTAAEAAAASASMNSSPEPTYNSYSDSSSGVSVVSNGGSSNGSEPSSETVEGIAGNIWIYGTWGDTPHRRNNMIAKFGEEQGEKIFEAVQAKFNSGYGYNGGLEHDWEYYKKFSLSSFRSGGYTGVWAGDGGKIGLLHQKEMVLNQEDTENLLNTVSVLRSVMSSLGGTISARLGDIKSGFANVVNESGENIEQTVHIDATFPNVDSKKEIEEAFNDLVNLAAQRAMRR